MIIIQKIFFTSVGRKSLMAVTGLGLILFLIGHLSGNLLIFVGQDAMNEYALALRSLGALLWVVRGGLAAIFVLHIVLGLTLAIENRRARPDRYQKERAIQASLASRSMAITGMVILAFVIYHLAHLTFGALHVADSHITDSLGRHDVYGMVIESFQQPVVSIMYIIAMAILALHLSHGLPSLFQSIGWNNPSTDAIFKRVGVTFAIILFIGYSSIPLAIWLGMVQ